MSRCQHCNKLTHSEDLNVFFNIEDFEKVNELYSLRAWTSRYLYANDGPPEEIGKLKCGDIWIHFLCIPKKDDLEKKGLMK